MNDPLILSLPITPEYMHNFREIVSVQIGLPTFKIESFIILSLNLFFYYGRDLFLEKIIFELDENSP